MTNDLIYALISVVSHTDDFLSAYDPNAKTYFALLLKLVMTENLRSWKKNYQLLSTSKGSHLFVQGDSFLLQDLWNLPSFHPYPSSFPIAVVGVIVPQNMLWGDLAGYSYRADSRGIQCLLLNQDHKPDYTFSGQKAFIPTPAAKQRGYWTWYLVWDVSSGCKASAWKRGFL